MTHENEMEVAKALVRLEEKVDSLIALESRVRTLEDAENRRKGGWAMLATLLTASSALGGLVVAFFTHTPTK